MEERAGLYRAVAQWDNEPEDGEDDRELAELAATAFRASDDAQDGQWTVDVVVAGAHGVLLLTY